MNDDKITTIIAADYMYLVFLGDDETIDRVMTKLNKNTENFNKQFEAEKSYKTLKSNKSISKLQYIKYEISNPCVGILDEEQVQKILIDDAKKTVIKNNNNNGPVTDIQIDIHKKYVILDEGVETAQCLTYADISSIDISFTKNRNYTTKLMMLMVMINNDTHFKLSFPILQLDEEENPDKLISKWLKDHNLEDIVKELTIRPVNIVGNEHEILVFTAFIIAFPTNQGSENNNADQYHTATGTSLVSGSGSVSAFA